MELWFLAPVLALFAGLVALAPLGAQVLARGVVFIDLAVAQAAAAAALWIGSGLREPGHVETQAAAAAGALLCAGLVAALSRRWPAQREALIGLVYVAGACLAILGVRLDPHGGERLSALLAADILWADWTRVGALAVCALAVLGLAARGNAPLGRDRWFYPCFALVASVAVPVLGLMLVFACLIAPALWIRTGRSMTQSIAVSMFTASVGLLGSWVLDAPSGACVALAIAVGGAASIALAPDRARSPSA
jgi:zinc/manganese transport system permease protein